MEGKRTGIRVLVGGVFDILHVGHVHFLEQAKKLGDELVVIVANDETVMRDKGHRPINPAEDRAELLRALRVVDEVHIGEPGGISFDLVRRIAPDVIALGPDQRIQEERLKMLLRENGINAEVMRIPYMYKEDRAKTSKIIQRIMEEFCE
ncbi:MAG: FAD synthase [Thermococci archaeon]|nr:FAD synthase [Thermococci archaeon]